MSTLNLTVRRADSSATPVSLEIQRVANCGMASRNPELGRIKEMFDELATIGAIQPNELPMVVSKPPHLLTTDTEIVVNTTTSGRELEFVLLPTADRTYVGVGVDHNDDVLTDRNLYRANSSCPSVLAEEVWVLDDLRDHRDSLKLSCWAGIGDRRSLYQQATLDAFLKPDDLLEAVNSKTTESLVGTAVCSGTVSTDDDVTVDARPDVTDGDYYTMELYDPHLNRYLSHQYDVSLNDWVSACDLP